MDITGLQAIDLSTVLQYRFCHTWNFNAFFGTTILYRVPVMLFELARWQPTRQDTGHNHNHHPSSTPNYHQDTITRTNIVSTINNNNDTFQSFTCCLNFEQ